MNRTPPAAAILGLIALLPFLAGAGLYAFGPPNLGGPGLLTLLAWSAAVLSLLGGARFGMELAARQPPRGAVLAAALLPAVAAWLLLAAAPLAYPERQLGGFMAVFALQWLWDARSRDVPAWYPRWRTLLTMGALAALALALWKTLSL